MNANMAFSKLSLEPKRRGINPCIFSNHVPFSFTLHMQLEIVHNFNNDQITTFPPLNPNEGCQIFNKKPVHLGWITLWHTLFLTMVKLLLLRSLHVPAELPNGPFLRKMRLYKSSAPKSIICVTE